MSHGEKPGRCRISVRPTTIVTDFVPSTLALPTEAVVQAVKRRTGRTRRVRMTTANL